MRAADQMNISFSVPCRMKSPVDLFSVACAVFYDKLLEGSCIPPHINIVIVSTNSKQIEVFFFHEVMFVKSARNIKN
jgi:hypothetical protein